MPRSRCTSSTAIHSRRSRTILCSGDQIRARSAPAYLVASTFGTVISLLAGLQGDVGAVLRALEFYGGDSCVRRRSGSGEIGPGAHDRQDAAAGGDQVRALA